MSHFNDAISLKLTIELKIGVLNLQINARSCKTNMLMHKWKHCG